MDFQAERQHGASSSHHPFDISYNIANLLGPTDNNNNNNNNNYHHNNNNNKWGYAAESEGTEVHLLLDKRL